MYKKHIPEKKHFLRCITGVLMTMVILLGHQTPVFAAPTAQINGNGKVMIKFYSVSYSSGANASMEADGDSKVMMQADLCKPGDWAYFELTVENYGSVDAVLSDVIQSDHTSENIFVTFGISDEDAGEILKSGQQCHISIVVQLNPQITDSISASGDFGLTLVYEAADDGKQNGADTENRIEINGTGGNTHRSDSPKTGDLSHPLAALGSMFLTAVAIFFINRRRHARTDS